jgi:hypothetical protein
MDNLISLSGLIEELKIVEDAKLEFNHKIAAEMMISSLYFLRELSHITGVPIEEMDTDFLIKQTAPAAPENRSKL